MASQKHILGIVGSYRKEGMIDSAVSSILMAAEQHGAVVKKVYLLDSRIEYCKNCRSCMQTPGEERGRCVIEDDMEALLAEIENADGLVIGAPVNLGNVNALTRTFMERCVGYAYWPWGRPAPKLRKKTPDKNAVLVLSSAAPAWMARYLTGALRALKQLTKLIGARPTGILWIGLVNREEMTLSERQRKKARSLGRKLAS